MASFDDHHPKVIELAGNPTTGSSTDHDDDPTPTPPPPPPPLSSTATTTPTAPPLAYAVGYPPVIGYPQTEVHHYSSSHQFQPYNTYPDTTTTNAATVFRPTYLKCGVVIAVALSIIFFLTASIVLHIVLRPKDPIVKVNDFSVSNLTMSESTLEANITVENTAKRLTVEFTLETQITYKNLVLSSNSYFPVWHLGTAAATVVDLKMSDESGLLDSETVEEMKKEMETTRSINLVFVVYFSGKFKHSWWWSKEVDETFFCGNLRVNLDGDSKFGRLSETISCIISS